MHTNLVSKLNLLILALSAATTSVRPPTTGRCPSEIIELINSVARKDGGRKAICHWTMTTARRECFINALSTVSKVKEPLKLFFFSLGQLRIECLCQKFMQSTAT